MSEKDIKLVTREGKGHYITDPVTGWRWSINLRCCYCIERGDKIKAARRKKVVALSEKDKERIKELEEPRWMKEVLLNGDDRLDQRLAECPVCGNLVAFDTKRENFKTESTEMDK